MEYFSGLSQFQSEIVTAIKSCSDIKFTIQVKKFGSSYRFSLTAEQTNLSRDINLFYENDGSYYLEEPLSTHFARIRQRHTEQLEHEETVKRKDRERKELKDLKEKQLENQRMKEKAASDYRNKIRLEEILTKIESLRDKVRSSILSSGEETIATWSKGEGVDSETLRLIRVHNADSITDFFDVRLTEISIYYGETPSHDSSSGEADIVYERFNSASRAIERCKGIIIDHQLLD